MGQVVEMRHCVSMGGMMALIQTSAWVGQFRFQEGYEQLFALAGQEVHPV